MTTPYSPPPPGWYPDPQGGPHPRWWDGTQWTDATQGSLPSGWRPMRNTARAAAALLVLMAFAQLGNAAALQRRRTVLDALFDGTATIQEAYDSDRLVLTATFVAIGLLVAIAVVWLVWFHAAYRNAGTLRRVRHPDWVIWGWFLPILNLFRPKQMTNDIWMAGDERYDAYTAPTRVSFLVQAWWGTWIAGILLNAIAQQMTRNRREDQQFEAVYDAARLGTIGSVFLALSAVLAALVALRATDRLERRAAARAAA